MLHYVVLLVLSHLCCKTGYAVRYHVCIMNFVLRGMYFVVYRPALSCLGCGVCSTVFALRSICDRICFPCSCYAHCVAVFVLWCLYCAVFIVVLCCSAFI